MDRTPAATPVEPVLYPALRAIGRAVMRIFLRKIVVHATAPIPETGPIVFASNHPNGLLDPLSVYYVTERPVHFLAKSSLLSVPIAGPLLRRCGVLPVYRRMDDPSEMSKNTRTFEACYQLLGTGGAIGIFPEGISHVDPELKRLKTGAARIALEAEEYNGFDPGLRIVPVGLTFEDRSRFRSVMAIQIGEPIELAPYLERYRSEPKETVREVTDRLQATLKEHMLHLDHVEVAELVETVDALYHQDLIDTLDSADAPLGEFIAQRKIAAAVEHFFKNDPQLFRRASGHVLSYKAVTDRHRIREDALREFDGRTGWALWLGEVIVWGLLGLPIALYGTVNNLLPWLLTRRVGSGTAETPQAVAQHKIFWGVAFFGIFYALQIAACWKWLGPVSAVVYGISLPVLGLFAIRYWRKARAAARKVRLGYLALRRPRLVANIAARREALIGELRRLHRVYLDRTAG